MNYENFQNPEKLQIVNFTIPFEFFELEFFLWFLISEIENFRQKFIKKFIVRFIKKFIVRSWLDAAWTKSDWLSSETSEFNVISL